LTDSVDLEFITAKKLVKGSKQYVDFVERYVYKR